jgi:hypothetical protein
VAGRRLHPLARQDLLRSTASDEKRYPLRIASGWDNVDVMRSLRAVVTLAGVLTLAACGDSDDSDGPELSGDPREQVVAVVDAMRHAMSDGDGEEACSYMTDRGQRLTVTVVARDLGPAETCEEAVGLLAAELSAEERDTFSTGNVVTGDEVELLANGSEAEAQSDYRGAMMLKLVDGQWQVDVPFFVD